MSKGEFNSNKVSVHQAPACLLVRKYIEVKRNAFLKDKKVLLDGKNMLTKIIDLKGESWREYPTFYKIGDYYYV